MYERVYTRKYVPLLGISTCWTSAGMPSACNRGTKLSASSFVVKDSVIEGGYEGENIKTERPDLSPSSGSYTDFLDRVFG